MASIIATNVFQGLFLYQKTEIEIKSQLQRKHADRRHHIPRVPTGSHFRMIDGAIRQPLDFFGNGRRPPFGFILKSALHWSKKDYGNVFGTCVLPEGGVNKF